MLCYPCGLGSEIANRRERIPNQKPANAIEHMKVSPTRLDQKETSGFFKSLRISIAYPNGRRLPNITTVPNVPANMRLAIVPFDLLFSVCQFVLASAFLIKALIRHRSLQYYLFQYGFFRRKALTKVTAKSTTAMYVVATA